MDRLNWVLPELLDSEGISDRIAITLGRPSSLKDISLRDLASSVGEDKMVPLTKRTENGQTMSEEEEERTWLNINKKERKEKNSYESRCDNSRTIAIAKREIACSSLSFPPNKPSFILDDKIYLR
uniref:Uncharacterized protein n=1 Tax=Vespula pensylvanica TaxID=30213 RepID=A0A834PDE8_VESPE|nr:hypothetical protein H0235_000026 [Vespula pensylvanica]